MWLAAGQWLGLVLLAPAALADRRTRTVPDHYWLAPLVVGITLTAVTGAVYTSTAVVGRVLVSVLVVAGGGVALGVAGVIGGADAKALAVVAVLYPVAGRVAVGNMVLPVTAPPGGVLALAVVFNAAVFGAAYYAWHRLRGGGRDVPYVVVMWWAAAAALTIGGAPSVAASIF